MQFHIFISAVIAFIFAKVVMGLEVEGHKNIPRQGGLIIASNHLSNWDPPILGISAALRREVFFLGKEELFLPNKFYSLLIRKFNTIPLKREGIDRKSIRITSYHLRRGRTIVIFPEGKRNPIKGFLKPLSGVGYLALKNRVSIIPTYIEGTAEKMSDLIRRRKRVLVRFGKMIDVSRLQKDRPLLERSQELSNLVMKKILLLSENV